MEMFRKQLLVGGSRAALVAAVSFFTTPVLAQQAATAAAPVEEVTVTGTSIRGAAPVGSNVITVDQGAIRASGAKNMEELLNTIPALSTANMPTAGSPSAARTASAFRRSAAKSISATVGRISVRMS